MFSLPARLDIETNFRSEIASHSDVVHVWLNTIVLLKWGNLRFYV